MEMKENKSKLKTKDYGFAVSDTFSLFLKLISPEEKGEKELEKKLDVARLI